MSEQIRQAIEAHFAAAGRDEGKTSEIYTDDAAFAAHLKTPHFLAFDADTRAWIDDKAVEKWERG